jgi:hypothetical protein
MRWRINCSPWFDFINCCGSFDFSEVYKATDIDEVVADLYMDSPENLSTVSDQGSLSETVALPNNQVNTKPENLSTNISADGGSLSESDCLCPI